MNLVRSVSIFPPNLVQFGLKRRARYAYLLPISATQKDLTLEKTDLVQLEQETAIRPLMMMMMIVCAVGSNSEEIFFKIMRAKEEEEEDK